GGAGGAAAARLAGARGGQLQPQWRVQPRRAGRRDLTPRRGVGRGARVSARVATPARGSFPSRGRRLCARLARSVVVSIGWWLIVASVEETADAPRRCVRPARGLLRG